MRFFAIGAVLGGFLVAAARLAFHGDSFATALLVGVCSPLLALVAAAFVPTKPAPRKADPAKIARLERELGIAEAPTTRVRPPDDRTVEDCPRPGSCVIAHPCRKCGANRGEACVGDVYLAPTTYLPASAAFHGAPTFGHKIEGP